MGILCHNDVVLTSILRRIDVTTMSFLRHVPAGKGLSYVHADIKYFNQTGQMSRPRGYKTFFVLNSVEHEILNAHKYKNIKKFGIFNAQLSLECYFSRSYMLKCQPLLAF